LWESAGVWMKEEYYPKWKMETLALVTSLLMIKGIHWVRSAPQLIQKWFGLWKPNLIFNFQKNQKTWHELMSM
jgi:hypothetical protein